MSIAAPGSLVNIDGGRRLHLHAVGSSSPTVVFDAALGGSSISWTYVHGPVGAFARACAYDRAGFGWSDAGPLPRTAGRVADELQLLLERAGERPPYLLVGHSFGGLVMRIFAARHPRETAGLVLVDPPDPEDWLEPGPRARQQIARGTRMCRQGAIASRLGIARVVAELVGFGAVGPARRLADAVARGDIGADVDWILAPLWKLPPEVRRPLRSHWTKPKFFEALGSQIASISVSAAEAIEASRGGYGDLPLVTISASNASASHLQHQDALANLSTRGRHVIASVGGHWIPFDQPALIVDVIRETHAACGLQKGHGTPGRREPETFEPR